MIQKWTSYGQQIIALPILVPEEKFYYKNMTAYLSTISSINRK